MLENAAGGEVPALTYSNAVQATIHQLHAFAEKWRYTQAHATTAFSIGPQLRLAGLWACHAPMELNAALEFASLAFALMQSGATLKHLGTAMTMKNVLHLEQAVKNTRNYFITLIF